MKLISLHVFVTNALLPGTHQMQQLYSASLWDPLGGWGKEAIALAMEFY